MVLLADGIGQEDVAVAIAQQGALDDGVAFGYLERDVLYLLAVKEREAAVALLVEGVEYDVAFVGDGYVVRGCPRGGLGPVFFQLVVVEAYGCLKALRHAVGNGDTCQ